MATSETERNLADLQTVLEALQAGGEPPAQPLSDMAHRYLASSREGRGRISPRVFAGLILSELQGRFLHQRRKASETQVGRMLAAALRRARIDLDDRTHLVPCRLFAGSGADAITVGPVIFHRSGTLPATQRQRIEADPEIAALFRREFAPWGWVAEVIVRGCDRDISRERAVRAVDSALDMLRLYAGAGAAARLGRAGASGMPSSEPAGLWADSGGRLHLVRPREPEPPAGQDRLRQFHAQEARDWLDRSGRCLEPLVDPSLNWPLADRFRDAASWFGEATTETYRAARIVSFVTAVERAVVPGDHADVWRAVTRRAALLAHSAEGGELSEWLGRAGRVYEIRSQIVHGGISPLSPEAGAAETVAAGLARAALSGALSFFEELGLTRVPFAAERLEKEFRKLEKEPG